MADNTQEDKLPEIETWEQLRYHIHQTQGLSVDKDDPVMVAFILHKVFLRDYDSMLQRHNTALTTVIGTAFKGLTEQAQNQHFEDISGLANKTQKIYERQFKLARFFSVFNVITIFVGVLVLYYLFTK